MARPRQKPKEIRTTASKEKKKQERQTERKAEKERDGEAERLKRATEERHRVLVASGLGPLCFALLLTLSVESALAWHGTHTARSELLRFACAWFFFTAVKATPLEGVGDDWWNSALCLCFYFTLADNLLPWLWSSALYKELLLLRFAFVLLKGLRLDAAELWRHLRDVDGVPLKPPSDAQLVAAYKAALATARHADLASSAVEVTRQEAKQNPYRVLGFADNTATDEQIASRWRAVAAECHPDRLERKLRAGRLTASEFEEHKVRLEDAHRAHEVIGEPNARAAYDTALERARQAQRAAFFVRAARLRVRQDTQLLRAAYKIGLMQLCRSAGRNALGLLLFLVTLAAATSFTAFGSLVFVPGAPQFVRDNTILAVLSAFAGTFLCRTVSYGALTYIQDLMAAPLAGPQARASLIRAVILRLEVYIALADPSLSEQERAALLSAPPGSDVAAEAGAAHLADEAAGDVLKGALTSHVDAFGTARVPDKAAKPRQSRRVVLHDGSCQVTLTWSKPASSAVFVSSYALHRWDTGADGGGPSRVVWSGAACECTITLPPSKSARPEQYMLSLIAINAAGQGQASVPCVITGAPPVGCAGVQAAQPPPQRTAAEVAASRLRDEAYAARDSQNAERIDAALAAILDLKDEAVIAVFKDRGEVAERLAHVQYSLAQAALRRREQAASRAKVEAVRKLDAGIKSRKNKAERPVVVKTQEPPVEPVTVHAPVAPPPAPTPATPRVSEVLSPEQDPLLPPFLRTSARVAPQHASGGYAAAPSAPPPLRVPAAQPTRAPEPPLPQPHPLPQPVPMHHAAHAALQHRVAELQRHLELSQRACAAFQSERDDAARLLATTSSELSLLRSQKDALENERTCLVCMDAPRSRVLMPCRHLVLCTAATCRVMLSRDYPPKCPLCRKDVAHVVDIFTS